MSPRFLACLALGFLLAVSPSCAPYARVAPLKAAALATAAPSAVVAAAIKDSEKKPLAAIGGFLAIAAAASDRLQSAPGDTAALRDYNFALSRVFSVIRTAKIDAWTQPLHVPGPNGEFVITARNDHYPERSPVLYDYTPSDELKISGSYLKERTVKKGLGAPLVAVRREPRSDARERFALARAYYGVTAVARFSGRKCEIAFEDPLATEEVRSGRRTFPLGADFSAPLALMLSETRPRKLEILNLLRPGDPAESARIVRLQPFDPNKTTVLVVHGLVDSPATWVPMLNELRGNAAIRKNFQFWLFEYPSGYPYPFSAAILRRELDAALRVFPQKHPMVLVGHSMGGLISRLMITDSGDKLWNRIFTTPPAQTRLSPATKKMFTESLIFRARPEFGRAIFISSPHRGSRIAAGWIGRLGTKLIRAPQFLLQSSVEALQYVFSSETARTANRAPTSVDTLSPDNPFVKAINEIPIKPGIPVHSIIGDRGKGNSPNSSDGAVPYWSSHLDSAVSEKIVPSGHSAHQNPEAIAEVLRILTQNRK